MYHNPRTVIPDALQDQWSRLTPFQQCVYAMLLRVPEGRVVTYLTLANAVGGGSPRAVGQALRRNPMAPDVPCHRVIGSDLRPGGFMGRQDGEACRHKIERLSREGVAFASGKLVDPARLLAVEDLA